MYVNFGDGWLPEKRIIDKLNEATEFVLKNEEINPQFIEISVIFVSPEEIKDLNRLHRNKDQVTDVLSFPQYEDIKSIKSAINDLEDSSVHEEIHITLGDVVICMDKIKEQADFFCHSFDREVVFLYTHSILHLLSYDHEEDEKDNAQMREIESMTLDEIGMGRKKNDR